MSRCNEPTGLEVIGGSAVRCRLEADHDGTPHRWWRGALWWEDRDFGIEWSREVREDSR